MRTITKTLYEFDELSEEAKDKARSDKEEEMRENEQHDAFQWAIDDCSLFEPPHTEMAALLGEDYYDRNKHGEYGQFVFKNTRKGISYSAGNDMVAIADALEITNDQMFKTWLGVPEIFHSHVTYNIENFGKHQTSIEFEHDYMGDDPRASLLAEILDKAQDKFNNHLWSIGDRVSKGIECYFESDNVESRLEDCEFDEEGNIQ
jgi:hypothetical protein